MGGSLELDIVVEASCWTFNRTRLPSAPIREQQHRLLLLPLHAGHKLQPDMGAEVRTGFQPLPNQIEPDAEFPLISFHCLSKTLENLPNRDIEGFLPVKILVNKSLLDSVSVFDLFLKIVFTFELNTKPVLFDSELGFNCVKAEYGDGVVAEVSEVAFDV